MMNFSFFKAAKPKRFTIVPRYYDPEKEDLDQRVAAATREVLDKKEGEHYADRISSAFERRRAVRNQASSLQFFFVFLFLLIFFGYLYAGEVSFFLFLIIAPVYYYIRKKNLF